VQGKGEGAEGREGMGERRPSDRENQWSDANHHRVGSSGIKGFGGLGKGWRRGRGMLRGELWGRARATINVREGETAG